MGGCWNMNIPELVFRITLGFFCLYTLTRLMGRKEISQMTFFSFASAIAIGSITANLLTNPSFSILHGIISLTGWAIITLLIDTIELKSKKARKLLNGDPIIIVKNGELLEKSLRKSRLDVDTMNTLLRQQNVFSIKEVDYAIYETNGKLSILKKEEDLAVTKGDMNIASKTKIFSLPTEIIADGKVLTKNLAELDLNHDWLMQQLKQVGISTPKDVMYAEVQQDGSLFIGPKEQMVH